jgi:hypothetical protein
MGLQSLKMLRERLALRFFRVPKVLGEFEGW